MIINCVDCGSPVEAKKRNKRYCDSCKQLKRAKFDNKYIRDNLLHWRHGLTVDDWEKLWESQGGLCYLCQEPMTRTPRGKQGGVTGSDAVIEHDHSCCPQGRSCGNCRRGLAHRRCNSIIGMANDDPSFLVKLAESLAATMV